MERISRELNETWNQLKERGVDLSGLEQTEGSSFRWRGRYRHDLNAAETLETHLGVFSNFRPKIPEQFRRAPFVFLANIDPDLLFDVLQQAGRPRLVALDTMNYWITSKREELEKVFREVDLILIMSVNPGFGGQGFIDSALRKIEQARRRIDASGRDIRLEVDGGIKADNIARVAAAGADTFVAGSAIFGKPDYKAVIDQMRAALK